LFFSFSLLPANPSYVFLTLVLAWYLCLFFSVGCTYFFKYIKGRQAINNPKLLIDRDWQHKAYITYLREVKAMGVVCLAAFVIDPVCLIIEFIRGQSSYKGYEFTKFGLGTWFRIIQIWLLFLFILFGRIYYKVYKKTKQQISESNSLLAKMAKMKKV